MQAERKILPWGVLIDLLRISRTPERPPLWICLLEEAKAASFVKTLRKYAAELRLILLMYHLRCEVFVALQVQCFRSKSLWLFIVLSREWFCSFVLYVSGGLKHMRWDYFLFSRRFLVKRFFYFACEHDFTKPLPGSK